VKQDTAGFTLAEVLVAISVLGLGLVALAGSSALVTRMVGRGQKATAAAQVAALRLERLRLTAYSTSPKCTALASGTAAAGAAGVAGVSESWTVTVNGSERVIAETVTYRTRSGVDKSDIFTTVIEC
jgi:prepilin-type N-terminal cleavage/methylation domain-containing protein